MGLATQNAENVALMRQALGWFIERDMDAFLSALDEDIEARPRIKGAPVLRGREAVERWCAKLSAPGDELEVRPLDYEAIGDCVIVRGYIRHRENRTLAESQVYWLYEVREGLITRMESHPTRAAALAAV
jgi:ketosteroid isomerase-like protein